VNSSEIELFERLYTDVWRTLRRREADEVPRQALELLHCLNVERDVRLQHLVERLGLPKSTASAMVKDLERRGLLRRRRNPSNERELAIGLTARGAARVAADSLLDRPRLEQAMAALSSKERRRLLKTLGRLLEASQAAASAEATGSPSPP
jgi:DNA-binding MarR family transcriptional regulator